MLKQPLVVFLLFTSGSVTNGLGQITSSAVPVPASTARLQSFVEANIKATHAYEALDAKKLPPEPDGKYWNAAGASDQELNRLIELQKAMLSEPIASIAAWSKGEPSTFDEKKYIRGILDSKLTLNDPKLPVNVWISWFKEKAPQATLVQVESVANLQQMMAEINRDADLLQDLYRIYAALHLPVYFGQLGIKASSDQEFMSIGMDIGLRMRGGPYEESPLLLQVMLRKMYNWGRRYNGERNKVVIAKELLRDPALKPAIAKAATVGAKKIAVIGHSLTMEIHWSTPSAFVPTVTEMMKIADPQMQFKYFQAGGLEATRAYQTFYPDVLKWHPDLVLFVVEDRGPENRKALKTMIDGFTAVGTKCVMFDSLWPAIPEQQPKMTDPFLSTTKLNVIEVTHLLMSSPNQDKFFALDHIHMAEPWHRLMAIEWFKYLAGARSNELAGR